MRSLKAVLVIATLAALAACTPAYVKQQADKVASTARLTDSVDIERTNQRVLSRQAQVCLVSDMGQRPGAEVLRTMQMGFTGYFAAVGVQDEPMDYLRAVATVACPGASYLFFVQAIGPVPCVDKKEQACDMPNRFTITILSRGDETLLDRVTLISRQSFIPFGDSDQERLTKVFARLAAVLTASGPAD